MKKLLPLLICLSLPLPLTAQEGAVAFTRAVKHGFEVPEGMRDRLPDAETTRMVLLFNANESLMMPAPEPEVEGDGGDRRARGWMERMRRGSTSRSDQETIVETYTSFADGEVVETREFMGRAFRIEGARPSIPWRLAGEQRAFMGFAVQKATAEHEGGTIEAWFTPDIPVPAGPDWYGGLPGMILLVSVDDGRIVYTASDVSMHPAGDVTIARPDEGDGISRDEYETIVAEKLDELEAVRGSGDRRPFP